MTQFGPGFISGGDPNTKVLLHMDGANNATVFTDSANPSRAWTARGAAVTNTAYGQPGASFSTSCDCALATGYIDTPNDAIFNIGSGPFTAECFFYIRGGAGTLRAFFGASQSGTTPVWGLGVNTANRLLFELNFGSGVTDAVCASTLGSGVGYGWHHVACVRSADLLTIYLDGVSDGAFALAAGASFVAPSDGFAVGRFGGINSNFWNGAIDEFRFSSIARWTANFTPPSVPYV